MHHIANYLAQSVFNIFLFKQAILYFLRICYVRHSKEGSVRGLWPFGM